MARVPERFTAAHSAHEAFEDRTALDGVRDLWMKLHTVEMPRLIRHGGERRVRGARNRHKTGRQAVHAIAVAHPHIEDRPACGVDVILEAVEQCRAFGRRDLRETEFAMRGRAHATTELLGHGLHAIADAEHRDAQREHCGWRRGRLGVGHRFRTTREDDAVRAEGANRCLAHVPRVELAIHADFAHAARDELGVLRAEIEDQDAVGVDVRSGRLD